MIDKHNPSPDELDEAKQKVCQQIQEADEYVVLIKGIDPDGDGGVLSVVSASPQNFGHFANAMQTCQMKMAHTMLGQLLGEDDDAVTDVTDTWLHADPLPDPDSVEIPDCLPVDWNSQPAEDNRDWDKPGGEF